MSVQRKPKACARMMRIRCVQDRIARRSLIAARDALRQTQMQGNRIDAALCTLAPQPGTHSGIELAAQMEMSGRLGNAKSHLAQTVVFAKTRYDDAVSHQNRTANHVKMAEKLANASQHAADAAADARSAQNVRPKALAKRP